MNGPFPCSEVFAKICASDFVVVVQVFVFSLCQYGECFEQVFMRLLHVEKIDCDLLG